MNIFTISHKNYKGNCLVAKIRHLVPPELLKSIYNAHIQPFLDYGVLTWSVTSLGNTTELTKLQYKSIRLINFKNKNFPIEPLLASTKILPTLLNINFASCKFIWKLKNKCCPPTIHDVLSNMGVKSNLRNQSKFIIPHTNLEIAKRFVTYEGIKNWNKLPSQVTCQSSLKSFSKMCKNQLISTL